MVKAKKNSFIKKYTLINLCIFIAGLLVGTTFLFSYQSYISQQNNKDRDQTIDFLYETSLLINENQTLHNEVGELQEEVLSSKTGYEIARNTQLNIEKLNMILGKSDIIGEGIQINIEDEIPYYVFIDMLNDLNTLGSEAISINGNRITSSSSFTENTITHQVFVSHTPISSPYVINVIGDSQTMYNALQKPKSFLARMVQAHGLKNKVDIIKKEEISIKAAEDKVKE